MGVVHFTTITAQALILPSLCRARVWCFYGDLCIEISYMHAVVKKNNVLNRVRKQIKNYIITLIIELIIIEIS